MSQLLARRVLLIGWDAADWKVINPLLDAGQMPALEFLINRGVMGNMATLRPILSPMLWNSIATGKRPDKHGICGFSEPDPHTGSVRPVTSTSRKVKAIWNILTQRGYKTHQVGWYASHPAEPINGISISDLYTVPTAPAGAPWPMAAGTVRPESMADTFASLRMHPADVLPEMILPFIPRAAAVDQEKDPRLRSLAKILAETATVHNAATWILEHEEWDFMAVFYSAIDHFSHAFMNFHPPKLEPVPGDQFELYRDVLAGGYRFHDMLLARLLELAGPETTYLVVSDHGFHSDHLRPVSIPKEPAGPAIQHRPIGIFAMMGPGVRQDARIDGATLLDITPTVLTLFGLPVAEDMDGRVLLQAFDEPPEVDKISSWELEPGACGMHPDELRVDAESSRAVLEQFVALGYLEAPGEDQKKAVETAVREQKYNLARVYLFSRRPQEAVPLLEELARAHPEEERFARHLVQCYMALERPEDARGVLEALLARVDTPSAIADWLRGELHFGRGETEAALDALLRAEQLDPQLPDLHIRIAQTYLRQGKISDADRALSKALAIDPDSVEGHLWMARVRLRQRRDVEAAEEALNAVGLEHFLPLGHFFLGVALTRLRRFKRAIQAFETVLSVAPGFAPAHRWLARLHSRPRGHKDRARQHTDWLRQQRQHRRVAAASAP
jgi:predicted AlkP superfamily phosphohydrolase/phosphomutase/tetratricopeptide (TPR) repeat protein